VLLVLLNVGCGKVGTGQLDPEKDYMGASVAELPGQEQIEVARSIEWAAQANWGEGGPLYGLEVAEAFLLGEELPHFEDVEFDGSSAGGRGDAVAFLFHNSTPDGYFRGVELYLESNLGIYFVGIETDPAGRILTRHSYFKYEYFDEGYFSGAENAGHGQKVYYTEMNHPTHLLDLLNREPDEEMYWPPPELSNKDEG